MSNWLKKFTFRDKRSIKHQVNGTEFRFYPNRMALLAEARDLSEPIACAINILFADQSRDAASAVKRTNDGDFFQEDIVTEALDIDMAKHRVKERDDAIKTIMGTLADKRSLMLLGKLFMDSLRDDFPYAVERHPQDVDEFLYGTEDGDYHGLDAPQLMEMVQGWMKANATVFGSAGEQMVGLVRAKIEGLRDSSLEKTDSTSGSTSKTPSSPQLVQDSQPSISTD